MTQQYRMAELEVAEIVFDDELQVRVETNQETIQEYYEAMETEEDVQKFPPPTVYFDGCRYWLADGRHRYWAAFRRGYQKMLVKVIDGSHDDAILSAVKLNSQHGLRFNDDDWEKIIPLITSKEQWKDWTNRRLAEELKCNEITIRRYRPENSVATGVATEKRVGKDGKMYKAKKDKKPKADSPEPSTVATTSNEPSTLIETVTSDDPLTAVEMATSNEPSVAVETAIPNEQPMVVEMKTTAADIAPPDSRLIEVNVKRTQIYDTISQLEIQMLEWLEIAPKEQHEDFKCDICERLRPLYC